MQSETTFPSVLSLLDRYEPQRILGEGAFGVVVLVHDRVLDRPIALKFIHPDRRKTASLLREAKLLASLDHPNICKVYEVGEVEGQSYIAMPFLEGITLEEAAPEILKRSNGIQELVRLVAKAAEAVWYAHARGLLHRDLKASNILILRSTGADPEPVILDLGLAASLGEEPDMDMRHDVWALGETLYTLLGGMPSSSGPSSMVSDPTLAEARPPLSEKGVVLPKELEAILAKALDPLPERRYASALAFALDLRAFLEFRPVEAYPIGAPSRLGLWVHRNRALATSISVATTLVIGLGVTQIFRERRAAKTLAYTQRFTREAEQIESLLHQVFAMPQGDVPSFLVQVRQRMNDLEAETPRLPRGGQAALAYALGRAHLSLGELTAAKVSFDHAALLGFEGPELDYYRGMTYAQVFLDEIQNLGDKAREAKLKELGPTLLEPASRWLRQGRSLSLGDPDLGGAFLAAMENRLDDVLILVRKSQVSHPYAWEPFLLEGWVHRFRAARDLGFGQFPLVKASLQAWETVQNRAESLGRSCASVASGRLAFVQTQQRLRMVGGHFTEVDFAEVEKAGKAVLALDPEQWKALGVLSDACYSMAELRRSQGQEQRDYLKAAIDYAQRGIRTKPDSSWLWTLLADALDDSSKPPGLTPEERMDWVNRSIEAYRKSLELAPGRLSTANNLGTALNHRAELCQGQGLESIPDLQEAITVLQKAIQGSPNPFVESNIARTQMLLGIAQDVRGVPATGFEDGVATLDRVQKVSPELPNLPWVGATFYAAYAEHLFATGGDPFPALQKSREFFALGDRLRPGTCQFIGQPVVLRALEVRFRLAKGLDARAALEAMTFEERAFQKHAGCDDWKIEVQANTSIARLVMARVNRVWDDDAYRKGSKALDLWLGQAPTDANAWLLRATMEHLVSTGIAPADLKQKAFQRFELASQKVIDLNRSLKKTLEALRKD
jgi:serine/threonine-protein kinase